MIYTPSAPDRIIFIGTPIDDNVANKLLPRCFSWRLKIGQGYLALYQPPGGAVHAGLLYMIRCSISGPDDTVCMGLAASTVHPLAAGSEGSAFPHARVMIHQPLGGCTGRRLILPFMPRR